MAAAQIVLSEKFKKDLIRWGFKGPIHVETTVANDECLEGSLQPPRTDKARTNLLFLSRVGKPRQGSVRIGGGLQNPEG